MKLPVYTITVEPIYYPEEEARLAPHHASEMLFRVSAAADDTILTEDSPRVRLCETLSSMGGTIAHHVLNTVLDELEKAERRHERS